MEKFRPGQKEVIRSVLAGKNTLAVLPTGAGKSLCFQLPGLHLEGTTVVVSPLLSLMKDQREKLEDMGIEVLEMNSQLTQAEEDSHREAMEASRAEFVYATPERLSDPEFLTSLKKTKIDLLVVDEAHCVSQWGHDFRPAYLKIHEAIATLGHPPVLALTATATPEVADDIKKQLRLDQMEVVRLSVARENLYFEAKVLESEEKKMALALELARETEGPGIIYVSTVKAATELHERLRQGGVDARLYHGKLKKAEREESQNDFMSGRGRVMVATNAFGMGVDKADIRFVIHFNFPGCLEAYYQEAGRAGRDGLPARCVLLYLKRDKAVQALFLSRKYPDTKDLAQLWRAMEPLVEKGGRVDKRKLNATLEGVSSRKLALLLTHLKNLELIGEPEKGWISLERGSLEEAELRAFQEEYRVRAERDQEKLKTVIQYAQSALCRWKLITRYFGEDGTPNECGHCDNCENPARLRLGVTAGVAA